MNTIREPRGQDGKEIRNVLKMTYDHDLCLTKRCVKFIVIKEKQLPGSFGMQLPNFNMDGR
jgi:hypothetical protein